MKYSTRDLICDVIQYRALSFDIGKIKCVSVCVCVYDKMMS